MKHFGDNWRVIQRMNSCNNCGTENQTDVAFCTKCGNALITPSTQTSITNPTPSSTMVPADNAMVTKAIIAIILNFFLLWGLGYWYLGFKTVFGQNWYMLIIVQIIAIILSMFIPFLGILYLITNLALAFDLYEKASGKQGFVPN